MSAPPIVVARETTIPADVEAVRAYHERAGAFVRLSPPWRSVRLVERSGGLEPGARTVFKGRFGPVPFTWVAEHVAHDGNGFTDEMRRGPLAVWRHRHDFDPAGADATRLRDRIEARLPMHAATPGSLRRPFERDIEAMLRYRHAVTADDFADPGPRNLRIAITGASGLIGSRLRQRLEARGHTVAPMTRRRGQDGIWWNPNGSWDPSPLRGFDAVVHLAGESIGGRLRWTEEIKRRILESREQGTRSLATALAAMDEPPPTLVSASAVGIYGDRGDEPLDDEATPGTGFLAKVCTAWEAAADPARRAGIRVVHPRIGVVVAAGNAAIKPLSLLASAGLLGPLGNGRQRMPLISLHDLTRAIEALVGDDEFEGPVNLTTPITRTQREIAATLSRLKHRPSWLAVPAFAIRALLGELGGELLLSGQDVIPARLLDSGFQFRHPTIADAFAGELGLDSPT